MGIEWPEVITANAPRIAAAAGRGAGEVVCLLLGTAAARAGHTPAGVMQLILDTPLSAAAHLTDPSGAHRIACLPVRRDRLIQCLGGQAAGAGLPAGLRDGGPPTRWVVCVEGAAVHWYQLPGPE